MQSTIQPPLPYDTIAYCLEYLCLSLAEYARYSHLLYFFPFTVLPDRPLQSMLEPWSRRSPMPTTATRRSPMPSTTWSSPSTRSSLEIPSQEASPFRSCCGCASLLKAPLFSCVCTQILLLPLTLCSRVVVFEPSWPLACNIKLVLLLFIELCCDYLSVSP